LPAVDDAGATLAAADRIAARTVRIFGRDFDIGDPPDWHASDVGDPWPADPWWRIDLRPEDGRDVKYVFELGRHAHLVTLARAASVAADPAAYVDALERHLDSWFRQNPPEIGVHWYSNLEIALRAVAWLQVIALAGHQLQSATTARMAKHLYHSGRHITAELPYTLSSMRNNHLIGDAVGLVAIGKAFPDDRRARRWAQRGDRMLQRHLPSHVFTDGSSLEDSLGYRGFVLELLNARIALGGAPQGVVEAAGRARSHLRRLGVGSGPVPHFGDWDGGSAFGPGPVGPSPRAHMDGPPPGHPDPAAADAPTTDGADAGGAISRLERGGWTVWLKAGSQESHGHADLLSVSMRLGDRWVVGDPGNGSYNRSLEVRDYFRTTIAHSALRLEGEDQRVPHRRFRWRYSPTGAVGLPFDLGPYRVMWGTHTAYQRLDPSRTVLRACLVGEGTVVVADWIEGAPAAWALSLPLHPDVTHEPPVGGDESPGALRLADGTRLGLLLPGPAVEVRGSRHPFDGWWADDYDVVRPAARLEVAGTGSGPVTWAVWTDATPRITAEESTLRIDRWALRPARASDGRWTIEPSTAA
jgi:hypothetical protein